MIHQSLPHFSAYSAFIERSARFSSFSRGNFGEIMNSFAVPDPLNPYSHTSASMQGPHEIFRGNGYEMNMAEASKETSFPVEHGTEVNPLHNEKRCENFLWSQDKVNNAVDASHNKSDMAEFKNRDPLEKFKGAAAESSGQAVKDLAPVKGRELLRMLTRMKKRKPHIHVLKQKMTMLKVNQRTIKTQLRAVNLLENKVNRDPKDQICRRKNIYMLEREKVRPQNSHSLVERVGREKISERMKYLQDLVPGCNKVTGKAVMLDEIINYVQSPQRQVEFLSMKLATVNPRLDFNIEAFLAKDVLQPRTGLPSSLAFLPDMNVPYPPLHPSQPTLIQSGIRGLRNSSDALRRAINLRSTDVDEEFQEPSSQVSNAWEDSFTTLFKWASTQVQLLMNKI